MRTDLFDFELPEDLIALRPAPERDGGRMLVVGATGEMSCADKAVRDLPSFLHPGDAIVFNNTKVLPAALEGRRSRGDSAVKISVNLVQRLDDRSWHVFAKPGRRLAIGDVIAFARGSAATENDVDLAAEVLEKHDDGLVTLRFNVSGAELDAAIATAGYMPLPPYIAAKRKADAQDDASYQTVYAKHTGAVAAPTAGLHFTDQLLSALKEKGVGAHHLTLHVGAGTFLPVKSTDTAEHKMHAEWGEITLETATALNDVRQAGGRIFAVGTTSLRLLETAAADDGTLHPFKGETDIFITPGYRFKAVDALLTNFHLPKSTLFMLVSAFAGLDQMQAAYAHAVAERYRFYSYGDATLLFRSSQNSVT